MIEFALALVLIKFKNNHGFDKIEEFLKYFDINSDRFTLTIDPFKSDNDTHQATFPNNCWDEANFRQQSVEKQAESLGSLCSVGRDINPDFPIIKNIRTHPSHNQINQSLKDLETTNQTNITEKVCNIESSVGAETVAADNSAKLQNKESTILSLYSSIKICDYNDPSFPATNENLRFIDAIENLKVMDHVSQLNRSPQNSTLTHTDYEKSTTFKPMKFPGEEFQVSRIKHSTELNHQSLDFKTELVQSSTLKEKQREYQIKKNHRISRVQISKNDLLNISLTHALCEYDFSKLLFSNSKNSIGHEANGQHDYKAMNLRLNNRLQQVYKAEITPLAFETNLIRLLNELWQYSNSFQILHTSLVKILKLTLKFNILYVNSLNVDLEVLKIKLKIIKAFISKMLENKTLQKSYEFFLSFIIYVYIKGNSLLSKKLNPKSASFQIFQRCQYELFEGSNRFTKLNNRGKLLKLRELTDILRLPDLSLFNFDSILKWYLNIDSSNNGYFMKKSIQKNKFLKIAVLILLR